jgi:hypothetical protein
MTLPSAVERRHHRRSDANLVVSYRVKEFASAYDISQSKNVSQGGMLLTTNREFRPGDLLLMTLRLPFMPDAMEVTGQVVGSREIVRDLIYDTRVRFTGLDRHSVTRLGEFVLGTYG